MERGKDYIGVGVGAAIISPERKLLLALRGREAKNEKGCWEIPGGGIEWGETATQAAKREMKEELGLDIEVIAFISYFDHIIVEEAQHWVAPTYLCKIISGEPKILEPHKCDGIGWFTLKETQKLPLSLITIHSVNVLKEKYPNGLPNLYS